MFEHSNAHFFQNWVTERIVEMNAALASLEARARTLRDDSNTKVDQLIADLKKRRDHFKAAAKQYTEAGEAALDRARAELESQWNAFEAQVKAYFATAGKETEEHQSVFRDVAAAQLKAWREVAGKLQDSAAKLAAERRADIEVAVKQMKSDADEAEARLQKFNRAGRESWSALSAALAESRKTFDKANEKARHAFNRAAR